MLVIIVSLAVVALIVVFVIGLYNGLVSRRNAGRSHGQGALGAPAGRAPNKEGKTC